MILVVCFHHDWIIIPGFTAIFSRFGLWGVDIFLFLSGFGCVYALKKYKISKFFSRRISRLLPTCLVMGLLVFYFDFYIGGERTLAPIGVRFFSLHRWYIQAIIICYLLFPLYYFILKRFKAKGLLICCIFLFIGGYYFPSLPIYKINWVLCRIPVFLIGMYISLYDLKINKIGYLSSGIFLILAIYTRCKGRFYWFDWTLFLALSMPFICYIVSKLINFRRGSNLQIFYKIITVLGVYSLEIYLIHEYLYWTIGNLNIILWIKYILFIVVLIISCFIVKRITDTTLRVSKSTLNRFNMMKKATR